MQKVCQTPTVIRNFCTKATHSMGSTRIRQLEKGTSKQRSGKGAIKKDSHSKNRDGKKLN